MFTRQLKIYGLILALGLTTTTFASAQYQVNNRNVLDRNLQRGTGGINPYRQPEPYGRAAEAIITGRSAGLSAFRGIINYGPAGEFSSSLSTDDLFAIERRSMPLAPGGSGYSYSLTNIVRRDTNITSGDFSNSWSYGSGVNVYNRSAFSNGYSTQASNAPYGYNRMGTSPQYLGMATGSNGRLLELNASPLAGVTYRDYNKTLLQNDIYKTRKPVTNPGLTTGTTPDPNPLNLNTGANLSEPQKPEDKIDPNNPNPLVGTEQSFNTPLAPHMLNPGVLLGQHLQNPAKSKNLNVDILQEQVLTPNTIREPQAAQDPYFKLINSIREQQGLALLGPDGKPVVDPDKPAPVQPEVTVPDKNKPNSQTQLNELLEKLRYDVKPLSTLSGQNKTAFTQSMRDAERYIADGQYYKAENSYRSAMLLRPTYPMANVGRLHSQLGAGMFRSSALTMRDLFAKHPELIAARYTQPLLPNDDRIEQLQSKLLKLADDDSQRDAPLLLAYIAYQQNKPELVEKYLNLLSLRAPNSAVTPLLKSIWLKPEADKKEEAEEKEAKDAKDAKEKTDK